MNIDFVRAKAEDVEMLIGLQNQAFRDDFIKYGHCPAYNESIDNI